MSPTIILTEAASAYIKKSLQKYHGAGFRLSIKKTGCSGYSYSPSVCEQINPADVVLDKEGIKLCIDPSWLHLLDGLQVDYVEEEKSGLKQKRLVFTNPNESSRCGCGESFHVERD